jgi:DNA (cytosine-5)-methyltransferase 1
MSTPTLAYKTVSQEAEEYLRLHLRKKTVAQQAEAFLRRSEQARMRPRPRTSGGLRWMDWFCGAGGSSQGIDAVPGAEVTLAANHWTLAIATHAANFPHAQHERGDIRDLPVHNWPVAEAFWASPECKKWTLARGKSLDYASTDVPLPGFEPEVKEEEERSRALMWDVPKYLEGVQRRGKLVLVGVIENVVEARGGRDWNRLLRDIHNLGYKTRLIAFNSMHAQHTRTGRPPQSRDRLYLAYWHVSLGRDPDWDKWLRPEAYCPKCDKIVSAVQRFKNPSKDMGRYRQSYLYRCPSTACGNTIVEPDTLPALSVIDPTIEATRIGDRPKSEKRPEGLSPATMARVQAGIRDYWMPLLEAAADGDQVNRDTLAPLIVPCEGREGKKVTSGAVPIRAQTTRRETGIVLPPFVIPMRGGGDKEKARLAETNPLHTVSAGGNHHGYIPPHTLLVPYYGTGKATTVSQPVGALTTRDRYAIAAVGCTIDIADVLFRMLEPEEVGLAMAFANDFLVLGAKRQRVTQYGNAVTPPIAELIASALMEAVTGEELDRYPDLDPRYALEMAA